MNIILVAWDHYKHVFCKHFRLFSHVHFSCLLLYDFKLFHSVYQNIIKKHWGEVVSIEADVPAWNPRNHSYRIGLIPKSLRKVGVSNYIINLVHDWIKLSVDSIQLCLHFMQLNVGILFKLWEYFDGNLLFSLDSNLSLNLLSLWFFKVKVLWYLCCPALYHTLYLVVNKLLYLSLC